MEEDNQAGEGATKASPVTKRTADTSAIGNDSINRGSKRAKKQEQNEYLLEGTTRVLTAGTGEVGVANKIVGFVQDCLRLDALKRVQKSNRASEISVELHRLLDAQIADEAFTEIALRSINKHSLTERRQVFDSKFVPMLVESMKNHPLNVRIQAHGCSLFNYLKGNIFTIGGTTINDINSLLFSKTISKVLVGVLEKSRDDRNLVLLVLSTFNAINDPGCAQSLVVAHANHLEELNVPSLCLNLLALYLPLKDDIVVFYVLLQLTKPNGGQDRPILRRLAAETPNFDQLLDQISDLASSPDCQLTHSLSEMLLVLRGRLAV